MPAVNVVDAPALKAWLLHLRKVDHLLLPCSHVLIVTLRVIHFQDFIGLGYAWSFARQS